MGDHPEQHRHTERQTSKLPKTRTFQASGFVISPRTARFDESIRRYFVPRPKQAFIARIGLHDRIL